MSVSGFKINGVVEKYNFPDLDNIDVGTNHIHDGAVTVEKLGNDAKTLLHQITPFKRSYINTPFRLGQTISAQGVVSSSNTLALSDYIEVHNGEIWEFLATSDPAIDIYVAEFTSTKEFTLRTKCTGSKISIGSSTSYIRILFGRPSASQVAITAQDLKDYLVINVYNAAEILANIANKINEISRLSDIIEDYTGLSIIEMTYGKVVSLSSSSVNLTPADSVSTPVWCAVVPCTQGDRFLVSGRGGSSAHAVGFVKANGDKIISHGINTAIDKTEYVAPTNAAYLVLNNYEPGLYSYKINSSNTRSESEIVLDLNTYATNESIILATNKWTYDTGKSKCIYIGDVKYVRVKASSTQNAIIAFLQTDSVFVGETPSFSTGYSTLGRFTISSGETNLYKVANDAKYLYIATHSSTGVDISPETVSVITDSQGLYNITKRDSELPEWFRIVRKKANQLKDIRWTALESVPKITENQNFTGDIRGIPYSSTKEYNKVVGITVSMRTFMTATKNPYSLLYTENINGGRSSSGYGLTYHGANCGAYYGSVCSTLTAYCLGMRIPWISNDIEYLSRIGILEKRNDQTAKGIYVGDIIWEPGHVNIITNVYRDEHGTPVTIDWTETASDLPKTTHYTSAQFNTRLANRGGIIYRPLELYKNTGYYPSEFVAVDDEPVPEAYPYNPDICTFAGDYAAFRLGEEIYINYNLGEVTYTQLKLYDNEGTLLETYSLDTSINSSHKLSIGSSLEYGLYTATLSDGTNESDPTHFEVIDTTVTMTKNGDILTVNFTAKNAQPLYATVCYLNGTVVATKLITTDEVNNRSFNFDYVTANKVQRSVIGFTNDLYLKVMFYGQYGATGNTIIPIV